MRLSWSVRSRDKNPSGLRVALSAQPRFGCPGTESWPQVAPNTCSALALASPLGAQRGVWLEAEGLTAGDVVSAPPPPDLLDTHFDTCLWLICAIKGFDSLIYLFVIVFHNSFHSKARTCF